MTLNGVRAQNDAVPANPFVGLRPFRSDEALLFFGRREQTAELLDRLHRTHFLAVVGSSGCGKSSLIRAGLIPALKGGFLVGDRDQWVDIAMTPGKSPLARLAREFRIAETDLREGGALALVEWLKRQPEAADRNCFLLVDQFEELFRFASSAGHREDAADFVSIVLALAEQRDYPVFVTLTMRSDFLGDCDPFYGLPEAFNRGQYLVPRLSRSQRREAIEGPARLFHREITPQLIDRVLNDVGDEPDQLPVMEHALMRTWENWQVAGSNGPVDLAHYLAAGGAKEALSRDAESAMDGMSPEERSLTETLFKSLTDTDASNRRIRRPAGLSELALVSGRPTSEINRIVDRFRSGGRSFLNVQEEPESGDALIDISHESLIRQWRTLRGWVDEEAESKRVYLDLVNAVERKKALLHDADLQVALAWLQGTKPTEAWARRYSPLFTKVMAFLDASREEKAREDAEEARGAAERLRQIRQTVAIVSVLLAIAIGAAVFAGVQWGNAQKQTREARKQASLAEDATDKANTALGEVSAALKNAAAEKERADGNAAQSKANAAEAEKQRQIAMANAKEEERQRQIAVGEGAKADASAKIAEANAKEAKDKAREAVDNAENAEANAKIAEASAKEAKDARQAAVDESTRANLLLAQALVQYAGRLVHDGRKEEAMASMSRALQVDKASMDAKSWIFDLLLHGGFRASAATPGEPFIHAPWDLQKRVLSVVYSPDADGRFIAAGSWDHAQIWEAKTATRADGPLIPPGPVTSHPGTDIVNSVAFSKDGRLVTASADNMIRIWDVATRRLIKSLDDKAPAVSATFSPDGLQVLTASLKDHGVTLWNVSDGSGLQFPLSAPAGFAAFCPNGRDKLVVTASWDKPAQVWDVSGKLLASFGPSGKVRSAQFSPDCTYIVTALGDSTAQVWEWNKERPVGAALLHTGAVNSAAFSQDPHGLRVVTASDDKTARVWDASTGTPIGAPLVHGDRVMSAAFSPDGKRVVTACYDGKVRVWDVWFDFDDTKLLADLAESLSGYKSAELPDRLVKLSDQEKQDLLNALREAAVHPPAGAASTAFFLRWFFSISN